MYLTDTEWRIRWGDETREHERKGSRLHKQNKILPKSTSTFHWVWYVYVKQRRVSEKLEFQNFRNEKVFNFRGRMRSVSIRKTYTVGSGEDTFCSLSTMKSSTEGEGDFGILANAWLSLLPYFITKYYVFYHYESKSVSQTDFQTLRRPILLSLKFFRTFSFNHHIVCHREK